MPPPSPPLSPLQVREAVRDLIGILRGYYMAEHDSPSRRATIIDAGRCLHALLATADGTPEFDAAMAAADRAINAVFNQMHCVAPLGPVLGHAAHRAIAARRR